ncbi:MAG: hypothetical protein LBJ31_11935 [Treponema sp.]|jgi:hypothetical protein|nr:hypothetical protein [Treponema sp.]
MAIFKTLRQKDRRYVFDFLGNRKDPNPAVCVFARFPQPDENFMPNPKGTVFKGINLEKLSKGNNGELERFTSAFMEHFSANMAKVDYAAFIRECVEHFENFNFESPEGEKSEIKTVEEFLLANPELWAPIARDCYKYAQERDEFALGE